MPNYVSLIKSLHPYYILPRLLLSVRFVTGTVVLFHTIGEGTLAQNKYLGVGTCSSSNCHGSVSPKNSTNVLQNEYVTWFRHGAHGRAWKTLKNADSRRIASNLGIQDASTSKECLPCHTTYVPKALQGARYRIEDGVSCEACHGAAEKWLKPHTSSKSSHANNVKLGLLEISDHERRAKMCMDCHFGNENQVVNHRLIGAGHPRLTFELDTYGLIQPNHWNVDEDYIQRKGPYNSAKAWMIGQTLRSIELMKQLRSSKRARFGAMPELTNFYCYTCHHNLEEDQWKKRSYGGNPGELRLNLSSLIAVKLGLEILDGSLAKKIDTQMNRLHADYRLGKATAILEKVEKTLSTEVLAVVKKNAFSQGTSRQLLKAVTAFASKSSFMQYEEAEQCLMAISAMIAAISPGEQLYEEQVNALYKSTESEESFNPVSFSQAARALKAKL